MNISLLKQNTKKTLFILSFLANILVFVACEPKTKLLEPIPEIEEQDQMIHPKLQIAQVYLEDEGVQPFLLQIDHVSGIILAFFDQDVEVSNLTVHLTLAELSSNYFPKQEKMDFTKGVIFTISHPEAGTARYVIQVFIKK